MALTRQQMHQNLALMLEHFHHLTFAKADYILSYFPITERKEVTPQYFEEEIRENHPNYQLCFPQTNIATCQMDAVADDDAMETGINSFGVTEPTHGNSIPKNMLDIIFVPLAVFDTRGHRVGYGKGFYDRFISQCRADVATIGLSFFEPVQEIADAGEFDIPLKYCITPQQLYEF